MRTNMTAIRGMLTAAMISVVVTGCASSGGKSTGSYTKVPPHVKKKKEPVSNELNLAAARVMMRDERHSEARKVYKEILERDPDCVDAVLGIARLDELAMRPQEAEEGYRKAAEMSPNSPIVLAVVGEYYAVHDQYEEAQRMYERAVELDPDQKTYHYHLGVVLTKSGRVNEALPHFTQSVGAAAGHYNVGRILYDQKRLEESEQHLLQAVAKDPKLSEAQQWLREVQRAREGELARRGLPNSESPISRVPNAPNPFASTSQAVAQTSGVLSQQVAASGNTTQILPGGSPQIGQQNLVGMPSASIVPAGANSPVPGTGMTVAPAATMPNGAAVNIPATGAVVPNGQAVPAEGGMNPVQLEQMRNQQMRAQQQGAAESNWNGGPRAY